MSDDVYWDEAKRLYAELLSRNSAVELGFDLYDNAIAADQLRVDHFLSRGKSMRDVFVLFDYRSLWKLRICVEEEGIKTKRLIRPAHKNDDVEDHLILIDNPFSEGGSC